jgi:hypothetical protein
VRLVLGRKIEGFVALACRAAAVLGSHDGAAWNALANGSTAATATTHIVRISLLCFAALSSSLSPLQWSWSLSALYVMGKVEP